jgi:hypothetical protein
MRLVLAFDADNGDIYAAPLQEFIGCQSCCAAGHHHVNHRPGDTV